MKISELLAQLPARVRFVPGAADQIAFDQALEKGWTVTEVADTIINGVGSTAHSPSGLAVRVLRSAAGSPPPAKAKTGMANGPALPKPECQHCGQPYGRYKHRPALGPYDKPCVDCGEQLTLINPPPVIRGGR